jgi:hypothetical protein
MELSLLHMKNKAKRKLWQAEKILLMSRTFHKNQKLVNPRKWNCEVLLNVEIHKLLFIIKTQSRS